MSVTPTRIPTDGPCEGAVGFYKPHIIKVSCGWTVWCGMFIYKAKNWNDALVYALTNGERLCLR